MKETGTDSPVAPSNADPAAPRWLDGNEMAAWLSFIETQGDLLAALEADLTGTGLTLGDYQVFVYLTRAEQQAMRMCDLAAQLQLTPSGLTRRLDGLVTSGWVERRGSTEDRRVMLAVLTESGRTLLEQVAPVHLASVRNRIIDRLDVDELVAMASIFGKIRAALDCGNAEGNQP